MAKFVGTVQEFHHFIGPKLRNAINGIARNHRNQRNGICEECQLEAELQSAHIHGRERRKIIEQELREFIDVHGVVSCTLEEIEAMILNAHLPIEHTFRFLCHACHVRYDSGIRQPIKDSKLSTNAKLIGGEFPKLSRVERWANRPNQINHKIVRAFLKLEQNGEVEYSLLKRHCTEILHISGFDGHYASMKTDGGNAHGKIFFNEGSKVMMWERVRKEVERYFVDT